MLSLLGISLFAVGYVGTMPLDISGQWRGDDWGQVVLTPAAAGEYDGTFSETDTSKPGKLHVRWSRFQRRFIGTWSEGQERFGTLSIHLVDHEIRGAYSTDPKSYPNTPKEAELTWTRVRPTAKAAGPKPSQFVTTAERFVDLLIKGDFDKAAGCLDDTAKAVFTPAALRQYWTGYATASGKFTGRGQARAEHAFGFDIVFVPVSWERNKMDLQLVFDQQGLIGSLFMVAPGTSVERAASAHSAGSANGAHVVAPGTTLSTPFPLPFPLLLPGAHVPAPGPTAATPVPQTSWIVVKRFSTTEAVLSRSLAVHEGAWSADVKSPQTLRLFEITEPGPEDCTMVYGAKLRTQDFQGKVYLEMLCRLPGRGEFVSRARKKRSPAQPVGSPARPPSSSRPASSPT